MTHYRLTDSMPSAIILARNPRSSSLDELKTYQGNDIFLNNGDEFQIRLFNPLSTKIGAQVSINGKDSNHLLVLNPGEDVVIDRFVDEQRRMIFETYQYDDNNAAAKAAVANNGIIDLKFFKEYFPPVYPSWNTVTTAGSFSISGGCFTTTQGIYGPSGNGGTIGCASTPTSSGTYFAANLSSGNLDSQIFNMSCGVLQDKSYVDGTPICDSNLDFESDFENKNIRSSRKLSKSISKKETGRVSKGAKSSQDFKSVDVQFEVYPFHTIVYRLKPMSEKNSLVREVREYCTSCGYRLRNDKWMFCPKCGEKL